MKAPLLALEEAPITNLFISVFRMNGALISAGDRLVGDLRLTSARWQVIGVIAKSPVPLPVASIARNMGLTRQAVQSVANDLAIAGLLNFEPNPHHRRAQLVVLTPEGQRVHRAATARQLPWAKTIGRGISAKRINDAVDLLQTILARL